MLNFKEVFHNLVIQSFAQVRDFFIAYGPGIAFAVSVIIAGWICAVLVKKIISKLLRGLGFDVLSEKIGFKRFLERGEIKRNPSSLIGQVFYWIIFINALVMASDAIDLKITSQFILKTVLYLPKAVVIIIFIALAVFISRFILNVVNKAARLAGIPFPGLSGGVARYATLGLAAMMILEYLELTAAAMTQFFIVIFIVVPAALFLAFLTGGKNIIASMLAKRYIMNEYRIGDIITFDSVSGRIEGIDFVFTRLKSGSEEIIIPNAELAGKIVRKK